MNTPTHALIGLAVLARGRDRPHWRPVLLGSLLPDLPIFAFFLFERLWRGSPDRLIWSELYFLDAWQDFFDLFNSAPLALLGLGLALAFGRRGAALLSAGVLLHVAFDLPVHREDAHRHLFPLLDWRFVSPVSYWDPAHGGAAVAALETALLALAAALLWRRFPSRTARGLLLGSGALQLAALALQASGSF